MDDEAITEPHPPAAIRRLAYQLCAVAFALALLVGLPGPASAQDGDGGFADADAGSLGVTEPVDIWCVIDAGSLGIPNPIKACAGHRSS